MFLNRLFRLFRYYTETESFDVSIEPKQTEDPPKQFKRESIFGYLKKKFGVVLVCFVFFLRNRSVCFGLFRYRFETPKQTEFFNFWFHETDPNKRETYLVSVCFGKFIFVYFEDTLSISQHPLPPSNFNRQIQK
jgi:hypothetical protein